MKKIMILVISIIVSCTLLVGCGNSCLDGQKTSLAVYSFSGENEQLSISNGVIVLNSAKETFYIGDLKEKQDILSDIKACTTTLYVISNDDKMVLMTDRVEDISGGTINVPSDMMMSGDIIAKIKESELKNNLYFELVTKNLNDEENTYLISLDVTEITKSDH